MKITLRQLEYFVAAGEMGSITLASEIIHISQPSISTAISHLEEELKVQLFVRHHAKGLSLTPVGRSLLAEAKRVIAQANGLYAVAAETLGAIRGTVSLGCMVTLAPMLVPELTRSFASAFPAVAVRHTEGNQEQLLRGLRHAEIDVALTYDLHLQDDIAFKPLVQLPPYVMVSETHRWSAESALTLADIANEPFVLLDLPLSREYFLSLFLRAGLAPHIAARSGSPEVVRAMVANGFGYALFNARPKSDTALDGRRLASIRLAGEHHPMTLGVATLKSLTASKVNEAFQAHLAAYISRAYIPGIVAPVATAEPRRS